MFSRSKTALSGSPPFPVADPKEVLTYMQVLTMECVTGVEVSASGIIHAVRIEAGALPRRMRQSRGTRPVSYTHLTINIPIFQSGRVKADIEQADAAVSQRQAEYDDEMGVVCLLYTSRCV